MTRITPSVSVADRCTFTISRELTVSFFPRIRPNRRPKCSRKRPILEFAVDEQSASLSDLPNGFEDEVRWDEGVSRFAEVVKNTPAGVVAQFARKLAALHTEIAARLPDNGRALVISHGGIVEASAVGCKPDEDYASWGPAFGYCEGCECTLAEPSARGSKFSG